MSTPTETSPLLPKPHQEQSAHPIDPSNGLVPEGADPYEDRDEAPEEDGGDIERQVSNGDGSKHQGLPEVKRRMKYIFPAIAIGVSLVDGVLVGTETESSRSF